MPHEQNDNKGEIDISDHLSDKKKWKGKNLVQAISEVLTKKSTVEAIIIGFIEVITNVLSFDLVNEEGNTTKDINFVQKFVAPLQKAAVEVDFSYFGALISLIAVMNGFELGNEALETLINRLNWQD